MKNEPKLFFALLLAGGILILIGGLFELFVAAYAPHLVGMLISNSTLRRSVRLPVDIANNSTAAAQLISQIQASASIEGVIGLICGIGLSALSFYIRGSASEKRKKLSAVAVALGIASFLGGSGFFLGLILSIIGGILAFVYAEEAPQAPAPAVSETQQHAKRRRRKSR